MTPEGYFDGDIMEGWTEMSNDESQLIMCFRLQLIAPEQLPPGVTPDDLEVVARHFTEGDYGKIGQKVAEKLGMAWPGCLKDLSPAAGQRVRVKVKHKKGTDGTVYVNAYVVTGQERKPASAEQIAMVVAKLEAKASVDSDGCPF